MKITPGLVTQLLFAGSAMAFAASTYVFASWNDTPWTLPVSADGAVVKAPFTLVTSGDFRVRLTAPTMSKSVDAPAPIWSGPPCLNLALDTEDGAGSSIRLDDFRTAGLYVYGGLAYFESTQQVHLNRGSHTAALSACEPSAGSQVFAEFQRTGEPTGQFLLAWLVRGLGWLLFAGAGVLSLVSLYRQRFKKSAA